MRWVMLAARIALRFPRLLPAVLWAARMHGRLWWFLGRPVPPSILEYQQKRVKELRP